MSSEFEFMDDSYPPELRAMMGVYVMFWKLDEFFQTVTTDPPLGKQERHLLVRLDQPKRMGVLAAQMAALPSTVTAAAMALEAHDLVLRERDPKDRRAWRVQLTERGEKLRNKLIAEAASAFSTLSGLTRPEIDRLADITTKAGVNILKQGIPEGMKRENC
ncbi:MarR family transcriptional regulator [Shimia sp. SDUM112013]|uniref:MarR family winged helix-turn-helix transcriptional regulator n=1 Tax=Shimia sp. SDUM112013 TaxID=3136160 RepID=UPI0032EB12EB